MKLRYIAISALAAAVAAIGYIINDYNAINPDPPQLSDISVNENTGGAFGFGTPPASSQGGIRYIWGDGLYLSTATVNVGCGTGLICNADDIEIDNSALPLGTGTVNRIPLWTPDGQTLGDSPFLFDGTSHISLDLNTTFSVAEGASGIPSSLASGLPGLFYAISDGGNWGIVSARAVNDNNGANITLYKTRATNAATKTALNNGDIIGVISFQGASSSTNVVQGARITATVDGSVSDNVLPTALVFWTTTTNNPAQRLIIDPDGTVRILQADAGASLSVTGDTNVSGVLTVSDRIVMNSTSSTFPGGSSFTYSGTGQTADRYTIHAINNGSYDATGANRNAYSIRAECGATRSAGSNNVTCNALYGHAVSSTGVVARALYTNEGDVSLNVGGGNTAIGGFAPTTINAGAAMFAGVTPKFEVYTGTAALTDYEELVVIRHANSGGSGTGTRRLGMLLKLSSEGSSGESNKSGGLVLESTSSFANSPTLSVVTNNTKRVDISANGNVTINTPSTGHALTINGTTLSVLGVSGGVHFRAENTATDKTSGATGFRAEMLGSFDATAADHENIAVIANAAATRSAGSNNVTNIGIHADANGGQFNYAIRTFRGNNAFNLTSGNTCIGAASCTALLQLIRDDGGNHSNKPILRIQNTSNAGALNHRALLEFSVIDSGGVTRNHSIEAEGSGLFINAPSGGWIQTNTHTVFNATGTALDVRNNAIIGSDSSDAHILRGTLNANSTAGTNGQVLAIVGGLPQWANVSSVSGVTGIGTAGRSVRWTSTNDVATGAFTDDGTNVSLSGTLTVTNSFVASSTAAVGSWLQADTVYAGTKGFSCARATNAPATCHFNQVSYNNNAGIVRNLQINDGLGDTLGTHSIAFFNGSTHTTTLYGLLDVGAGPDNPATNTMLFVHTNGPTGIEVRDDTADVSGAIRANPANNRVYIGSLTSHDVYLHRGGSAYVAYLSSGVFNQTTEYGIGYRLHNTGLIGWSSTVNNNGPVDVAIGRSSAGWAEINNGTIGNLAGLKVNDLDASNRVATNVVSPYSGDDVTIGLDWSVHTVTVNAHAQFLTGPEGVNNYYGHYLEWNEEWLNSAILANSNIGIWSIGTVNGGTVSQLNVIPGTGTAFRPGILAFGVSNAGDLVFKSTGGSSAFLLGNGDYGFEETVRFPILSSTPANNYSAMIGPSSVTNGCGFVYDNGNYYGYGSTGSKFAVLCRNGANSTFMVLNGSGGTVDTPISNTQWYRLRVLAKLSGNVEFYVNGILRATISSGTSVPSALGWGTYFHKADCAGCVSNTMWIDQSRVYAKFDGDRSP